jgi:predicted O-methyltransferase YrrM
MPLPEREPDSAEAVARWIAERVHPLDPFRHVYSSSHEHREAHGPGCSVYPTGSGPLLGLLAAATGSTRILEVGCGLGYSALWLAQGSAPQGQVETVEKEPDHAELARLNLDREGFGDRVTVLLGAAVEVLARLSGPYDLIFSDSDPDDFPSQLDQFMRLLSSGGMLVSSNLFLGQYTSELSGAVQMAAYRQRVVGDPNLLTAMLPDGVALSLRR